jgi:hypothetical protein
MQHASQRTTAATLLGLLSAAALAVGCSSSAPEGDALEVDDVESAEQASTGWQRDTDGPGCNVSPCGLGNTRRGDMLQVKCFRNEFRNSAYDGFVNRVCRKMGWGDGKNVRLLVLGRWRDPTGQRVIQFGVPMARWAADSIISDYRSENAHCTAQQWVNYATRNNGFDRARCDPLPLVGCSVISDVRGLRQSFAETGQTLDSDCGNMLSFDPWMNASLSFWSFFLW